MNAPYQSNTFSVPVLRAVDNATSQANASPAHWEGEWDGATLRAKATAHCVATWGPSSVLGSLPLLRKGEGAYLVDDAGKRYLDWTSQAICANLGHTVPESVKDAMRSQLETLPAIYGGLGLTESRVRLASLLSELCPADIDSFLFPSGGSEANEAAVRIARRVSGKHKIITQYRSYHGATSSSIAATGDFRRAFGESGVSGFVKAFNPQPFRFSWGDTDAEVVARSLGALEEQIMAEGAGTIAALMLESVVGSGGVLVNPPGYMEGVRALCDKHEILLILDEVMVGFGRTGEWWAYQHYEGVVPDIFTSAKGLSAAFQPIACVGVRRHIREFFEHTPLGWGATFHAHPVATACAYAVLKHMIDEDVVGNVRKLAPVMESEIARLVGKHSCVRQGRAVGLFGCLDIVNEDGDYIQEVQGPSPAKIGAFKARFAENGLLGFVRPPFVHCAPPLNVTEAELRDGFARLDDALEVLDF